LDDLSTGRLHLHYSPPCESAVHLKPTVSVRLPT